MISEKQQIANENNAKLGGVKTEEGKAISRANATKHGFFSQLTTEYDRLMQKDFCDEIYSTFMPTNIYEAQLIEIMLSNFLAYRRACLVESSLFSSELDKSILPDDDPIKSFAINSTRYQIKFREDIADELLKFQRYKTSAFNSITKTQHELERLTRIKNGEAIPAPSICDVDT